MGQYILQNYKDLVGLLPIIHGDYHIFYRILKTSKNTIEEVMTESLDNELNN